MITRRRVLSIIAGGAILPIAGSALGKTGITRWHGLALGAGAQIIVDHPDADRLIAQAVMEISRLERIFSLYLADSELSRLNRNGVLLQPSFEMVELLSLCSSINQRTKGAFDPTIQALWALYAKKYSAGETPSDKEITQAKAQTGWDGIEFSSERVRFVRPGAALSFNGIAQGFIADKIAALFTANGVENVLVNTGEIIGVGAGADGTGWPVNLGNRNGREIGLTNQAVATSAPLGTVFDRAGKVGHIIDPRTGYPGGKWSMVSVIANRAALADGLSTGFCLMSEPEILAATGDTQVVLS
ncbi:Nitrous oxide reductase maturation periplasmic protein NosX [hydrothermal vent metagenome]|uniref:FAD:protein FMN transferase n=1 Tax=hydrothermal vent metagenome TaxID=652676 RepID=A0A3B0U2Q4_9ZZZZ